MARQQLIDQKLNRYNHLETQGGVEGGTDKGGWPSVGNLVLPGHVRLPERAPILHFHNF